MRRHFYTRGCASLRCEKVSSKRNTRSRNGHSLRSKHTHTHTQTLGSSSRNTDSVIESKQAWVCGPVCSRVRCPALRGPSLCASMMCVSVVPPSPIAPQDRVRPPAMNLFGRKKAPDPPQRESTGHWTQMHVLSAFPGSLIASVTCLWRVLWWRSGCAHHQPAARQQGRDH